MTSMNSFDAIPSMKKSTLALTAAAGLLAILAIATLSFGSGLGVTVSAALVGLVAVGVGILACAGRCTQERQQRLETGQEDLFTARNASRSETAVGNEEIPKWSGSRRWLAMRFFGHRLMVGDLVRIKSIETIRATLDADGCLDGLPFMDEMATFCGNSLRVYRVVDKIYDYGRSRLMRRLDGCVLLVGLRCDGSAHGGCEAACYIIWKTDWLEPHRGAPVAAGDGAAASPPAPLAASTGPYLCQYTQLAQASRPMPQLSLHGLLGPLVVGNVSGASFRAAVLTRSFNALQARRGGAAYPARPPATYDKTLAGPTLKPGDWVRVKLPGELSRALDSKSKHRGLWFDRDMLKHAGRVHTVRGRIDRIIDVNSGEMVAMKTPCIVLDGVDYSGEFQGFGEQHDYLYWREVWLEPASAVPGAQGRGA